jgi:hypothetical protein
MLILGQDLCKLTLNVPKIVILFSLTVSLNKKTVVSG